MKHWRLGSKIGFASDEVHDAYPLFEGNWYCMKHGLLLMYNIKTFHINYKHREKMHALVNQVWGSCTKKKRSFNNV